MAQLTPLSATTRLAGYDTQMCCTIQVQDTAYYALLPRDVPGIYLVIGRSGFVETHGVYHQGNEVATIPILEYTAPTFQCSLRCLWNAMPAVIVLLPPDALPRVRHTMAQQIIDDLTMMTDRAIPCPTAAMIRHPPNIIDHMCDIHPSIAPPLWERLGMDSANESSLMSRYCLENPD